MDIKFHIPKNQTIPTELRLKIDDAIDVYYKRVPGEFAFTFTFLKCQRVTMAVAEEVTAQIVGKMMSQSYDHGSQWRVMSHDIEEDEYEVKTTVYFRVRDAW